MYSPGLQRKKRSNHHNGDVSPQHEKGVVSQVVVTTGHTMSLSTNCNTTKIRSKGLVLQIGRGQSGASLSKPKVGLLSGDEGSSQTWW